MRSVRLVPFVLLAVAAPALADVHLVPNPTGPLAGKTIVFSPGHGIFRIIQVPGAMGVDTLYHLGGRHHGRH